MRKISRLATILITSFVMALTGLVASPIASASENGNGSISATFPLGSSVLSNAQKAAIRKALASSGSDVSFIVTGTAGKLPGVSDSRVQRLAKKRAQAIKAYLVSLGVSNTRVTTQMKMTEFGVVPKSTGNYPTSASTVAVTNSAGTGSGSGSGGGTTVTTPGAPTSVIGTVASTQSVVSWTAPASTGGATITGYTATSNPGSLTCTTASTSCTVTGLTNGTAYTFTVTATNSAGTGSASTASSSITPTGTITTAGAPTSVSATAGDTQSVVTWSGPTSTGGATITGYTVTSSPGSFTCTTASTSCTVTGLTNGTAYTFTVTATNSAGTGSASTASSSITPLTCAAGGTCILGDTGPGGGKVYYVDNAGFSCGPTYISTGSPAGGLCKYLEVAPSGWNTGADPGKTWATGTSTTGNAILSVTGITEDDPVNNLSTGIGLGYKNSVAIFTQGNGTTTAAGAARAYAGGSKADWYLPTSAELTLLCQWNRGVTQNVTTVCTGGTLNTGTGTPSNRTAAAGSGFANTDSYWSSSQRSNANAWRQSFNDGSQPTGNKILTDYVRPIRAF